MVLPCDGKEIEIRQLYFLEIEDNVQWDVAGPYSYEYNENGQKWTEDYSLEDYEIIPEKPEEPEYKAEPGSELFWKWKTWHLYRAIIAHERLRAQQTEDYLKRVARYVLSECIDKKDKNRIITPKGYEYVFKQAQFPEVTMEGIEAELASTFQGFLEKNANIRSD